MPVPTPVRVGGPDVGSDASVVARLRAIDGALDDLTGDLAPECLAGHQVPEVSRLLRRIERRAAGCRLLLADAVARTGLWRREGFRSPEEWAARRNGTTVGDAKGDLQASKKLAGLPAARNAVASGEVSAEAAKAVAEGATADPGAEADLVAKARSGDLGEVRDAARSARQRTDQRSGRAAQRMYQRRALRTWIEVDGEGRGTWNVPPAYQAAFLAALEPYRDAAFRAARDAGRRDTPEALMADAMYLLARDVLADHDLPEPTGTRADAGTADPDGPTSTADPAERPHTDPRTDDPGTGKPDPDDPDPGHDDPGPGAGPLPRHPDADRPAPRPGHPHAAGADPKSTGPGTDRPRRLPRQRQAPGPEHPGSGPAPSGPDGAGQAPGDPDAKRPARPPSPARATSTALFADEAGSPPPPPGPDRPVEVADSPSAGPGPPARGTDRGQTWLGERPPRGGSRRAPAQVHVHVDYDALVRGYARDGERCEVPGLGPVPVALARDLATDAVLHLILTGTDVTVVSSHRRYVPASVERALRARDQECVVPGCHARHHLQMHHWPADFAAGCPTSLATLARICVYHHHLVTNCGWRLTGGPGRWRFLAPGARDPDEPP